MSIYIDINGSWGSADELMIIDDSQWAHADYEEMGQWTDRMVLEFSETHNGKTPTEWIAEVEAERFVEEFYKTENRPPTDDEVSKFKENASK